MVEILANRPRVAPRFTSTVIGAEPIERSGVTRSLPEPIFASRSPLAGLLLAKRVTPIGPMSVRSI